MKYLFWIQSNLFIYPACFKISLFRTCLKEAVIFTFFVPWLILVHIFGPRKDKTCWIKATIVFVFPYLYNATCVLVLYLLDEGLNTIIDDGSMVSQHLKTLVAIQYSILFRNWEAIGISKMNRTHASLRWWI